MSERTTRLNLPLLQSAQAQKEVTHNEAIERLDRWTHPVVESRSLSAPPTAPQTGETWIVAASATGVWTGQEGMIAEWGEDWSFLAPPAGVVVFVRDEAAFVAAGETGWIDEGLPVTAVLVSGQIMLAGATPMVPEPSGGATVDAEARTAIATLLDVLRDHGLLSA